MMKNANRLFVIIGIIVLIIAGRYYLAQNEAAELPAVTVVTNEQTIDSVRGSYCWHSAGEGICVDTAAPHEIVMDQKMSYVKVQPGEVMEFQYSQNVTSVSVQQWLTDYDYKEIATSPRFNAPTEKGTYIISSMARFSNGDVTDTIAIEVE
ncbi:cAMP-binding protein [Solibacillus silvestris]|uniref:cAMP-binding protein n=1 Tax=Solibacillus silvestris TaxID=76853 RepID=UPI003F7CDDED